MDTIPDDWRESVVRMAMQASLDGDGQTPMLVIIHSEQQGEHIDCSGQCWCGPLVLQQPLVAAA